MSFGLGWFSIRGARQALPVCALFGWLVAGCSSEHNTNPLGDGGQTTPDGNVIPPPDSTPLTDLVPQTLFEQIFLHRSTAPCPGAFYTYQSFIDAAKTFPTFSQEGTLDARKREIAAFLANASHETTGGWATAPDGPYSWGLCFVHEGGNIDTSTISSYCVNNAQYPCAAGEKYYGRGPLQLSYNYNYGPAGDALGIDILNHPDMVEMDPVIAWKTALWFWMTAQSPKPSCHAVMTGQFTPSAQDTAAGRTAGFGLTINIINGGVECNQTTPAQVEDRVGFYNRYCEVFAVAPGSDLYCDHQQSY